MAFLKQLLTNAKFYLAYFEDSVHENHLFLLASGLSFSVFTCIIPLVLVLFAVLGIILNQPQIEQEVGLYIERLIPYPEEAAFVKQLIYERSEDFKLFKNIAGLLGALGLAFMSSGLFASMRTILNRMYKIRSKKPIWSGKLKDLALLLLVLAYFLISITILPTSEAAIEYASRAGILSFIQSESIATFLVSMVSFVIAFASFFMIYWLIPQQRIPAKVLLISALVAAVLWQIANQLFGIYISHGATLKNVYGAYSLIVVTAIWIYYTSVVFIVGAAIGQAYREKTK